MRLVLVRSDGVAETVMIDVEEYDWNKPLPRQVLVDNLKDALRKAKVEENLAHEKTQDALDKALGR